MVSSTTVTTTRRRLCLAAHPRVTDDEQPLFFVIYYAYTVHFPQHSDCHAPKFCLHAQWLSGGCTSGRRSSYPITKPESDPGDSSSAALDFCIIKNSNGGAVNVASGVLSVSGAFCVGEVPVSESRGRFSGFLLSCLAISLAAARGRGIKSGAALLGVV